MANPKDAPDDLFDLQDRVNELTRSYVKNLSKSNEALAQHAHFMQTILDSAGPGIFVVDKEGKLLLVNKAASKIAGTDPSRPFDEQIDETFTILTSSGEPIKEEHRFIMKAMNESTLVEEELFVKSPTLPEDGIWVKIHAAPVLDNNGDLLGGVNVFHDITERKKAYERISNLYNQAPCGYMSLDKSGTIIDINDTFLDWIGSSRSKTEGKLKLSKLVTERGLKNFNKNFNNLIKNGEPVQTKIELKNKDGEIRQFFWTSKAINSADGLFLTSRCTMIDITDKVKAEHHKDALAALVTHDIKNHMAAESMLIDHLLDNNLESLEEGDIDLLNSLKKSNTEFLNIVTNLLQLYRLEKDSFKLSMEELNLKELVEASVATNQGIASIKNVSVSVTAENDTTMKGDRSSVSHIIHNLLNNAITLSPEGKSVKVIVEKTENGVRIQVIDQGKGISQKEMEILFEPLWRWKPNVATISRLGLYLCKVFIDAHRGEISVNSGESKGTTFTIFFPADLDPSQVKNSI